MSKTLVRQGRQTALIAVLATAAFCAAPALAQDASSPETGSVGQSASSAGVSGGGPSNDDAAAANQATTSGTAGSRTVTPGSIGQLAPTPDVTPGVASAGSSKVPLTGSTPNAATADYPTDVTADYVFACMASNGNSRTSLEQCSCSFDVVATLLPYDRYVEASTFLSMGQVAGEKGSLFRSSEQAKKTVGDLRRAQAEAEVRCFD